jgi:hypothetical protein
MVLLCLGVFGIFGTPQFGWGLTLDEAKTQGLVGETPTGYLGAVQPGATAEVQALVNEINQKRRQAYADIAQRNGTRLEAVEMLAGEKAIGNTKPGNFVQLPSGQWIKK